MELNIVSGSQLSQQSIDSSQVISIDQSFQSTQSLSSLHQANIENIQVQNIPKQLVCQSPKQMPRFGIEKRDSDLFCGFQQPFVGFMGMGKRKAIEINQSKLKRAKKFMEDEQQDLLNIASPRFGFTTRKPELQDSIRTQSLDENTTDKQYSKNVQQSKIDDFSNFSIGFKSLGTGATIQISQETTNRIRQMFKQFDISQRKQTKSKIRKSEEAQVAKFTNYTKTQKIKPVPAAKQVKVAKKQAIVDPGIKIMQQLVKKDKIVSHQIIEKIKLQNLREVTIEDQAKFDEYWKKYQFINADHSADKCQVKWCYFCQKYSDKTVEISKQSIKDQVMKLIKLQQPQNMRIDRLLESIIFKLCRYQFFNPTILNKQINANNIIRQLYKKCLGLHKQFASPLQLSISSLVSSNGKGFGKQMVLLIQSIAYSQQRNTYYIQLSDNWTNVYAIISSTNQLHKYLNNRMYVGSKIQIINWCIHPVSNILEFHPDCSTAKSGVTCIEITYNNSRPVQYWHKLGWPKQIFYKRVRKCREMCGSIALVEGIVIRMFAIRSTSKISNNYIQILLAEGHCILMKINLSEQVSLVQLFRLYYCYHFCRLKKISNELLQFTGTSRYYEIQDKQRIARVTQLLKKRLLNLYTSKEDLQHRLQANKKLHYDIITKSQNIDILGLKLRVDEKIEGMVLLQQYQIIKNGQQYIISKGDKGSCLRRIPKIYETIQYNPY